MINWNKLQVEIDDQARLQLDHYFRDLEMILDDQKLSYKKDEVFQELENYIIDYIRNQEIIVINFNTALKIIAELGPPDEYTDYSNLSSLLEKIEQKTPSTLVINPKDTGNLLLCEYCNSKNEPDSIYCIDCGRKMRNDLKNDSKNYSNPIFYLFRTNIAYFLSMTTILVIGISIFWAPLNIADNTLYNILILFLVINEVLVVPGLFIVKFIKKNSIRYDIIVFLTSYITKFSFLVFLYLIGTFFSNDSFWSISILSLIISIVLIISTTKLLFYSTLTEKVGRSLNVQLNFIGRAIYPLEIIIILLMYVTTMFRSDLTESQANYTLTLIFVIFIFVPLMDFSLYYLLPYFKNKNSIVFNQPIFSINKINSKNIDNLHTLEMFLFICIIIIIDSTIFLTKLTFDNETVHLMFSVFVLFFVLYNLFELYTNNNYKKSFNILNLNLACMLLGIAIVYSYTNRILRENQSNYIDLFPTNNMGIFLIIILFLFFIIMPAISILLAKNRIFKDLNENSFSNNPIVNFLIFILILILVVNLFLLIQDNLSINITLEYISGISVLMSIKPLFNITNYLFLRKNDLGQSTTHPHFINS